MIQTMPYSRILLALSFMVFVLPLLAFADTTPPTISNISSGSPGFSHATITWDTNESADSKVEYGPTTGYGTTLTDPALVTSRSMGISGLLANSLYHYRVISTDGAGNTSTSTDQFFTTHSLPVGSKYSEIGDSIIQYANKSTSNGSTIENVASGEIFWALFFSPVVKHYVWHDPTATYGGASTPYFRGANYGIAGDVTQNMLNRFDELLDENDSPVIRIAGGTNTDVPNTAAERIDNLSQMLALATSSDRIVILDTIRPRSAGTLATVNNILSTTNGSKVVTVNHTAHGLTNTSNATKKVDFTSPVSVGGITLSGVYTNGSGGVTVNVVNANQYTITQTQTATATVTNGGGTFTYSRNVGGLGILPDEATWEVYYDVNDWIRTQDDGETVFVNDTWDALRHQSPPSGEEGEVAVGMTKDGVHLAPIGAKKSGDVLKTTLRRMFGNGPWFNTDPNTNNLFSNGEFAGTSGIANFGITGTVPSNLTIVNTRSISNPHVKATSTLVSNPATGGQSIVLDITSTGIGTSTAHAETIRIAPSPAITTGFASTDYVSALWEVEIIGQGAATLGSLQATLGQSSTVSARGLGQVINDRSQQPYPTPANGQSFKGWIATEPLLVGTRTSLNPRLDLDIRDDVSGGLQIKVHRMMLRIVENPTVLFPHVP